jgi:uncharacterized membrane protein YidH (DUF202 family)
LGGHYTIAGLIEIVVMLALLALLLIKTRLKGRFHKRVFIAMFIVGAGMVYNIFVQKYTHLVPSMLFYFIPQIYLIRAFYLDFKSAPALDKSGARLSIAIAFILSISYYLFIRDQLGILRLPVMLGIFTTSFLFMMACFRNLRVNKRSFLLILVGVVVYMFAEASLAYDAFIYQIKYEDIAYAIGTIVGYALIVLGTIERKLIYIEGFDQ